VDRDQIMQDIELELSDEELTVTESRPVLVLGVMGEDLRHDPAPGVAMRRVYHQTAGVGCHHVDMRAIVLRPKPLVLAGMQLIERHWRETNVGAFGTSLDEILYYRMQLKDLIHPSADCNMSYLYLEEGAYPLDVDLGVLREICEDELPDNLDDYLAFPDALSRAIGSIGRWKCFILAENSD